MVDRQDIDALLIGALYGELTPADEARLTAHLESHPGDRSALDGLTAARQAVHDSRIFAVQLDPPQAISALLLQEAHRRAPRKASSDEPGWLAKLFRTLLVHPAMAAAAMLVVVVGVAGTMYVRKGTDQFAETTGETAAQETAPDRGVMVPAAPATNAPTGGAAGSGFAVGLAENDEDDKGGEGRRERVDLAKRDVSLDGVARADHRGTATTAPPKPAPAYHAAPSKKQKYVEVLTPDPAPKDLAEAGPAPSANNATTGFGQGAPAARPAAPPPPPTQPAEAQAQTESKLAKAPSQPKAESASKPVAKSDDSSLLAWAKGQHAQAISFIQNGGHCQDAAQVVLAIRNRAPDYYAQFVANDRALKTCSQYIDAAADKEAEKAQKARAPKRVNADEAPAAASH